VGSAVEEGLYRFDREQLARTNGVSFTSVEPEVEANFAREDDGLAGNVDAGQIVLRTGSRYPRSRATVTAVESGTPRRSSLERYPRVPEKELR